MSEMQADLNYSQRCPSQTSFTPSFPSSYPDWLRLHPERSIWECEAVDHQDKGLETSGKADPDSFASCLAFSLRLLPHQQLQTEKQDDQILKRIWLIFSYSQTGTWMLLSVSKPSIQLHFSTEQKRIYCHSMTGNHEIRTHLDYINLNGSVSQV